MKLILVIFVLVSVSVFPQTNSPYSRYGIGMPELGNSSRQIGMGGISSLQDNKDFLTADNPALLYSLNLTRLEAGIGILSSSISSSAGKVRLSTGSFSGFMFGIPVERDMGIGFALGVVPVSAVKYETAKKIIEPQTNTELNVRNEGEGGLSKFFVALSHKLPFNIAVGGGFNYYFGTYSYHTFLESQSSSVLSSDYRTVFRPRGSGGIFGLHFTDLSETFKIDGLNELKLSFTFSTPYTLTTDSAQISHSTIYLDTTATGQSEMKVPAKMAIGASYQIDVNFTGYFEYTRQNWSEYTLGGKASAYLDASSSFLGGIEYRPSGESGAFWKQAILRIGGGYVTTPFTFKGSSINEMRISAGASLPIGRENTIDLGLMYAKRGTTDNGLISEDIFKFSIGLSLGELWFQRQER